MLAIHTAALHKRIKLSLRQEKTWREDAFTLLLQEVYVWVNKVDFTPSVIYTYRKAGVNLYFTFSLTLCLMALN